MKFRLAGGAQPLMLVPVSVNGETPIEFILDTGAGTTILTPQTAASGGVEITGSKQGHTAGGVVDVKLGRIRSLAVGSAHVEGVDVAITDLSHLGKAIGTQIHGDLGYNFLRHFRVTINFRRSEVRLDDPKQSEFFGPPPLVEVPIRLAHPAKPLILTAARANGRGPLQFAIDTGTSTTVISPELKRELDLRTTTISPVTTGGAPIQMSAARLDSLRLGVAEACDLDVVIGDF